MSISIEILTDELDDLKHSLNKAKSTYESNDLSKADYEFYERRLSPKIKELEKDVKLLKRKYNGRNLFYRIIRSKNFS